MTNLQAIDEKPENCLAYFKMATLRLHRGAQSGRRVENKICTEIIKISVHISMNVSIWQPNLSFSGSLQTVSGNNQH